jgi:23S rRNA pseudouridine2605 synthase
MKLNAYISHAGICSRRKAAELVKQGAVTVNGQEQRDPSYDVQEHDKIIALGRCVKIEKFVYILLNKPKGYVTTVQDEQGRKTVLDLLGKEIKERIYPVGRLDRESTGALLLTNDGALAYALSHPRYEVAKTYHVTVNKGIEDKTVELIKKGVCLEDGRVKIDAISFCSTTYRQTVRIVLHNGKNRVIRRMFEALGFWVDKLDRVAYGGLTLRGLPRGGWRYLTGAEVLKLQSCLKDTKQSKN